jgi:hypothetical protein
MLIDLLIDAGSAIPDTLFERMVRGLDRSFLTMAELDERSRVAAAALARQRTARPRAGPIAPQAIQAPFRR